MQASSNWFGVILLLPNSKIQSGLKMPSFPLLWWHIFLFQLYWPSSLTSSFPFLTSCTSGPNMLRKAQYQGNRLLSCLALMTSKSVLVTWVLKMVEAKYRWVQVIRLFQNDVRTQVEVQATQINIFCLGNLWSLGVCIPQSVPTSWLGFYFEWLGF